jgi:Cu/Ag efflux protein CusF
MSLIPRALFAAALVFSLITLTGSAADEKKPEPKKEEKKAGVVPFNSKIKAVDATAKCITLDEKAARVICVADATKVSLDGKEAKLDELKAGLFVTGAYRKDGEKNVATSLKASAKAPEPKNKKPAAN